MRRDSEDAAYASANIYRNQNVYSESGYSCCSSNNDCQSCAGIYDLFLFFIMYL